LPVGGAADPHALDGTTGIRAIVWDLSARQVRVVHEGEPSEIERRLVPLGLGASLVRTHEASVDALPAVDVVQEARTLEVLLGINAAMFVLEMAVAWFAESAGCGRPAMRLSAVCAVDCSVWLPSRCLQLPPRPSPQWLRSSSAWCSSA
jgi:hypothetical protein